jgi:hypothetical protein
MWRPNLKYNPAIILKDWGKPQRTSGRIVGLRAEIWTHDLENVSHANHSAALLRDRKKELQSPSRLSLCYDLRGLFAAVRTPKPYTCFDHISLYANMAQCLVTHIYSETSICRSQIIRFPGSVVQFLWSLSESYFNYGSRIYCFPGSIVSFLDPQRKRWIEVSL